jgi:hypothetical protein
MNDRVPFGGHKNPLLLPYFWLRDPEIEEFDGTQIPNSQPIQIIDKSLMQI